VHIGSSPEGFAWRDALNMGKLDESASDPGVWRVRNRRAPHNAYTATAPDREFLRQRGRQNNHLWGPLRFSAEPPVGDAAAEHISLRFWPWRYQVDYQWDPELQRYLRFMEGQPHVDADTGEQIAPSSVVVQLTYVEAVPNDPKLRLETALIDHGGELLVFNGGRKRDGAWHKSAPRTSTEWRDSNGDALVLPYGQVWVEVVPLGSPILFQ
jgi:hypothetical protein